MKKVLNELKMENASVELLGYLTKGRDATVDSRAYFFCQTLAELKVGEEVVVFSKKDLKMILDVMPSASVEADDVDEIYIIIPPVQTAQQRNARAKLYA